MRGEYYHGGDGEGGLFVIQSQTAPGQKLTLGLTNEKTVLRVLTNERQVLRVLTEQLALGLELISSCHNSYYFSRDETKNISHFYFQILENN